MTTHRKISLEQYAFEQRKKKCPVCKLPADVLLQIGARNRERMKVAMVIGWLSALGHRITARQFHAHVRGGHELRHTR